MEKNKYINVLSKAALAAAFTSAAIATPAIIASAEETVSISDVIPAIIASAEETVSISDVIIEQDGNQYKVSKTDYDYAVLFGGLSVEETNLSYLLVNESAYSKSDYDYAVLFNGGVQQGLAELVENGTPQTVKTIPAKIVDGEIVADEEDFEVIEISAITKTGVTVNFPKLETAVKGAIVEVKNPAGGVVAVKAQDLAIGATEATFEFETELEELTVGPWTVGDITYEVKAEELVEVTSVSVIDATTMTVTLAEELAEDVTLDEKTITLAAGEETMEATFESIDGKVATFMLAGEDKFVDAITYTVSADWATFAEETVEARIADEALTSVEIVTEKLQAGESTIMFKGLDQYGEGFDLATSTVTIKASFGAMPVGTVVNTTNADNVKITSAALVKDRDIKIEAFIKDKDGKYTVKAGEKTLTVVKEDAKATSIASITRTDANKAKAIKAGDTGIELTAKVLDQFGNKYTLKAAGADVAAENLTWTTSDANVIAFDAQGKDFETGTAQAVKMNVVARANGTATITAFLPDGSASETIELSVVDGELVKIDTTGVTPTVTNKKTADKANVLVNDTDDAGALKTGSLGFLNKDTAGNLIPVKADAVEFEVTADTGYKAEDVTVEKVADANGNLTGLKITSNRTVLTSDEKAGTYTTGKDYTVTVKSNVEEVADKTFIVTTKIDSAVKGISEIAFTENEVPAGSNVDKEIVFTNKYGEAINVKKNQITINPSDAKLTIAELKTAAKEFEAAGAEDVVTGLRFNASAAEDYTATILVGTATRTLNVTAVKAAEVAGLKLGVNEIKPIIADKLDADPASAKDNLVKIGTDIYTAVPLTFTDNYGNEVAVKNGDYTVEVKSDVVSSKVETILTDVITDEATAVDGTREFKYILVKAKADATVENLTVTVKKASAELATAKLKVSPKAERVIKSAEYKKALPAKMVVDNTFTLAHTDFEAVDQYGDKVTLAAEDLTVTVGGNEVVTGDKTLTAAKAGTETVTVQIKKGDVVAYNKTSTITVVSADDLATLAIDPVKTLNPKAVATEDAPFEAKNAYNTATLKFTAKDVDGNVISMDATEFTWLSSDEAVAKVVDGVVTAQTIAGESKTGTATITAIAVNGVTATVEVTVVDEAIVATSIEFAKDIKSEVKVGEKIDVLDGIKVYDQTGVEMNVAKLTLEQISANDLIAKIDSDEVQGVAPGTVTIKVSLNDNASVFKTIKVTVTE